MEKFWRNNIEEIYQNFLINLQFMSDRCELCDVSFAQGRTPNYESIANRIYIFCDIFLPICLNIIWPTRNCKRQDFWTELRALPHWAVAVA